MGRQIGKAAGDEIRGFCDVALSLVNKTIRVARAAADEVVADAIRRVQQYSPDMMEEIRGTATGAGVAVDDIMLLQIRNQLQPYADEGCTSLALAGAAHLPSSALVARTGTTIPPCNRSR